MSASCSPPRTRAYSSRRRASYVSPDRRVSDAERGEVADRLSKHYSDGRLDQAEFDERLDQAMKAKTQADLAGLFADLPGSDESEAAVRQQNGHPRHRGLFLVLVVVIAATVGQALVLRPVPWLLIGLLAFLWWHYGSWHRRP
jgi:hypothetical protein